MLTFRTGRLRNKLKEKDQATFYSPTDEWTLLAPSTTKPEEREFVVDSGASMHMVSRKELNSAELANREDLKESDDGGNSQASKRRGNTVCQRSGYIRDSNAGKLFEDHGYNYHWTTGQKPHLIKNGGKINCNTELRTHRCPWSIDKFFTLIFTYFFITRNRDSHGTSSINKK